MERWKRWSFRGKNWKIFSKIKVLVKKPKKRIVKTLVFLVVTYRSKRWIMKRKDRRELHAFELWA